MKIWYWAFAAIVLCCCAKPRTPLPPPASEAHSIRYLALGDSYTIGESVEESARWPVQLAMALRGARIDVGDPTIIARTGWTTADLTEAIEQENPKPPFGLVTLLIGVNNQFRGLPEEAYRQEFVSLLNRSIQLSGGKAGHVVVLSIPDWGVTPFARSMGADPISVAAAIDRFNAINLAETKKLGVAYGNVTGISRSRRDLIAEDGLHPSQEMYELWMKAALPACEKALGN